VGSLAGLPAAGRHRAGASRAHGSGGQGARRGADSERAGGNRCRRTVTSGSGPAAGAERVKIRTDLIWAEIDPMGAVLVRAELPTQKLALDWTEQGLAGCWA